DGSFQSSVTRRQVACVGQQRLHDSSLGTRHGQGLHRFAADLMDFSSVAFAPDGKTLVGSSFRNGVCLSDVSTGKELVPLRDTRAGSWRSSTLPMARSWLPARISGRLPRANSRPL